MSAFGSVQISFLLRVLWDLTPGVFVLFYFTRDVSTPMEARPLSSLGSISSHTRPVESIQGKVTPGGSVTLYTGDTMGIIKVWELSREAGPNPRWKASLKQELGTHRTKINEMVYGNGQLWTGMLV